MGMGPFFWKGANYFTCISNMIRIISRSSGSFAKSFASFFFAAYSLDHIGMSWNVPGLSGPVWRKSSYPSVVKKMCFAFWGRFI